ncbi:MAG: FliH/SctL family protein [bacterium]
MSRIFKADCCSIGLPLPVGDFGRAGGDSGDIQTQDNPEQELSGVLLAEAKAEVRALIAEAAAEADAIVQSAQAEKEAILTAARQQAADIEADAYRAGREKGEQEAREITAAANALFAEAESVRQDAATQREEILRGTEGEIVEMVLAVAAKVIKTETETNREAAISLVRGAIAELAGAKKITVRAHPSLAEKLVGEEGTLSRAAGAEARVIIAEEHSFEPGECQIESDYGILEAGVDVQINNLAKAMLPECTDGQP